MSDSSKLPHVYPFKFISREGGVGVLYFSPSCDDAAGRGAAVPASIVLEALTQAGGVLSASPQSKGGALVQVARFRCPRPVMPGDQLEISAEVTNRMGPLLRLKVTGRKGARVATRAILTIRESAS